MSGGYSILTVGGACQRGRPSKGAVRGGARRAQGGAAEAEGAAET